MEGASTAVNTAFGSTEACSPILALTSGGSASSARQSRTSGWMPMARNSRTLCWVGLVLYSPAVRTIGTRVRWRKQVRVAPVSIRYWRTASRNGWLSMSPTVPPISAITTSGPDAAIRVMRRLISSVTCGITWTVAPR